MKLVNSSSMKHMTNVVTITMQSLDVRIKDMDSDKEHEACFKPHRCFWTLTMNKNDQHTTMAKVPTHFLVHGRTNMGETCT